MTATELLMTDPRPGGEAQADGAAAAVIALRDAAVEGPRGPVCGPVTAESAAPVTVVTGVRGSGRTSLLLALAGRMRLTGGEVRTLGERSAAAIRRRSGIAGFAEIDALEPAVTVGATLRERLSWAMPWYRRTPRIGPELCRELLEQAFGAECEAPDPGTLVRDLAPAQEFLLRIALALIDGPEILFVDDFDALRDPADRRTAALRLDAIAAAGIPVVLATSDPGDAALFADVTRIAL